MSKTPSSPSSVPVEEVAEYEADTDPLAAMVQVVLRHLLEGEDPGLILGSILNAGMDEEVARQLVLATCQGVVFIDEQEEEAFSEENLAQHLASEGCDDDLAASVAAGIVTELEAQNALDSANDDDNDDDDNDDDDNDDEGAKAQEAGD